MAKDYASQSYKKKRRQQKTSGRKKPKQQSTSKKPRSAMTRSKQKNRKPRFPWRLLFALIIFIVLLVGILVLLRHQSAAADKEASVPVEIVQPDTVMGKETSIASPNQLTKNAKQQTPAFNHFVQFTFEPEKHPQVPIRVYMLQLGTFPAGSDGLLALTDQLKKQNIKFQQVSFIRADQKQIRVQTGPYDTIEDAEKQWKILYQQKIYSLIREVRVNN